MAVRVANAIARMLAKKRRAMMKFFFFPSKGQHNLLLLVVFHTFFGEASYSSHRFYFIFTCPSVSRPTATAIGRSTAVELEYISLIFFYKLILLLYY